MTTYAENQTESTKKLVELEVSFAKLEVARSVYKNPLYFYILTMDIL